MSHIEREDTGTAIKSSVGGWFERFKEGSFDLEHVSRSGQSFIMDGIDLQVAMLNLHGALMLGTEELDVSQQNVFKKLHQFHFVRKKPGQYSEFCRTMAEMMGDKEMYLHGASKTLYD
ncbi:hypothetical protein KIN20_003596 [Parelaphostrongylus tenuis]|uniref:Uncharacterized protein n=1 Tax=Parelaphostrongylus tenuis TaxID=148309 RepID=A0AAD5LZE0_PARTN|nr:hypothetical protein KIN20_003596 [Parelaphostrongylus tenuis]